MCARRGMSCSSASMFRRGKGGREGGREGGRDTEQKNQR